MLIVEDFIQNLTARVDSVSLNNRIVVQFFGANKLNLDSIEPIEALNEKSFFALDVMGPQAPYQSEITGQSLNYTHMVFDIGIVKLIPNVAYLILSFSKENMQF